jgi:hypothetical protein
MVLLPGIIALKIELQLFCDWWITAKFFLNNIQKIHFVPHRKHIILRYKDHPVNAV